MSNKDGIMRLFAYAGLGYITYHLVRTGYYERQNQKLARHHGDITRMSSEELKIYEKVQKYNESHFGKIIVENLYSRKYLKDKIKARLNELETEKVVLNNKLYSITETDERKDIMGQIGAIQEEIEKLSSVSKQIHHSDYFDFHGEEALRDKQFNSSE